MNAMTTTEQIQAEKYNFNQIIANAVRAVENGNYAVASNLVSDAAEHLANLETLTTQTTA